MGMDPPILEGTQEFSIGKPPYSGSPAPLLWVPKSLSSSRPFRRDWFSHLVPYKFMTSHRAPILGTVGARQAGLREKEGTNIDTTELEEREDNYREREPPPPPKKNNKMGKEQSEDRRAGAGQRARRPRACVQGEVSVCVRAQTSGSCGYSQGLLSNAGNIYVFSGKGMTQRSTGARA